MYLLEPQSTALFVVLMVAFGALLAWVAFASQAVFRVFAAALAFIPAMLFGVAAVNKYYDYYETWGAIAADLGAQGVSGAAQITGGASAQQVAKVLGKVVRTKQAAVTGETARLSVTGHYSHLKRTVYVYLPPQYFQARYAHYRFPVIELITGFPGQPQDWINVLGIDQAYETLLRDGAAKPAVLVMPQANGARGVSYQCLNVIHGPQVQTFIGIDVPRALTGLLRVQSPGPRWGIAGYSEGGYCAANLALVYTAKFGFAGALSGYFTPMDDSVGNPPRLVDPFGKNLALRLKNTPLDRIRTIPIFQRIPQFWLGVGGFDRPDVQAAAAFQRLLLARQPGVVLDEAPGGAHDMATWRALVPSLLEWMTPRLATAPLHPAGAARRDKATRPGQPAEALPGGTRHAGTHSKHSR